MCVYIYILRTCLVDRMLLLIRMRSVCIQLNMNTFSGLVKRAQLLWHVQNFCETCTTAGKRAQHLWHVHNISETCTTSLKRAHIEYLKTLGGGGETRYTHIYIYISYIYNINITIISHHWSIFQTFMILPGSVSPLSFTASTKAAPSFTAFQSAVDETGAVCLETMDGWSSYLDPPNTVSPQKNGWYNW